MLPDGLSCAHKRVLTRSSSARSSPKRCAESIPMLKRFRRKRNNRSDCQSIVGAVSRCSRSCSRQRCYRSSKTHRGSDSGYSYRPRATQRQTSCSCNNRQTDRTPGLSGMETPVLIVTIYISNEEGAMQPPLCFANSPPSR